MALGTLSCLHRLRGRGRKTLLWGQLGSPREGRGRALGLLLQGRRGRVLL